MIQKELENHILLKLFEIAEDGEGPVSHYRLRESLRDNVGQVRIDAGLSYLRSVGLVVGQFDGKQPGHVISRKGILFVETNFDRERMENGSSNWSEKLKQESADHQVGRKNVSVATVLPFQQTPGLDKVPWENRSAERASWVSAWAAWAGVVVAIAAIIVTMFLANGK